MSQTRLFPLRVEPLYENRLWRGRRLFHLLTAPLPGYGPIGEAWELSDREVYPSRVRNGSLTGQTIGQVLEQFREQVTAKRSGRFRRFAMLLNFLDVRERLSVQVYPTDPENTKTEAWVVLAAMPQSRIYAGLKPVTSSLNKAASKAGFRSERVLGKVIEDRGSQITFSAFGQQSPLDQKNGWDPVLTPSLPQQRDRIVAHVVFPTVINRRDELVASNRFDIYCGMADNRIEVARPDLPEFLPPGGVADAPEAEA